VSTQFAFGFGFTAKMGFRFSVCKLQIQEAGTKFTTQKQTMKNRQHFSQLHSLYKPSVKLKIKKIIVHCSLQYYTAIIWWYFCCYFWPTYFRHCLNCHWGY